MQDSTVEYSAIQYRAVQLCTDQYTTALYSKHRACGGTPQDFAALHARDNDVMRQKTSYGQLLLLVPMRGPNEHTTNTCLQFYCKKLLHVCLQCFVIGTGDGCPHHCTLWSDLHLNPKMSNTRQVMQKTCYSASALKFSTAERNYSLHYFKSAVRTTVCFSSVALAESYNAIQYSTVLYSAVPYNTSSCML